MNRDVLHSLARKAGFGELMSQPKFVEILIRYTSLLQQKMQKEDMSIPKYKVCIEFKAMTSEGVIKVRKDIDSKTFQTMPVHMLAEHYGAVAVEFRGQLDDPN